jgi:hypothetical protein
MWCTYEKQTVTYYVTGIYIYTYFVRCYILFRTALITYPIPREYTHGTGVCIAFVVNVCVHSINIPVV